MPAQTKGVFYIVSFLHKINRLQRLLQAVFTYVRGFEPPTPWSVAKCSIQLSYTHTLKGYSLTTFNIIHLIFSIVNCFFYLFKNNCNKK